MRSFILLFALLPASLTAQAAGDPLRLERGRTRPLVVVAPTADDPYAAELARPDIRMAFAERQVVVFTVLAGQGAREGQKLDPADTAALLVALGLRADGPPSMVLIGKDGGVKLRGRALGVPVILATIDRMPMRREEMRRE